MTGFGTADGQVGRTRVTVELRSVNHRFFNPSIKLPSSLARFEGDVREALRRTISRGHITATARVERAESSAATAQIDEERFATYVQRLQSLQATHGLQGPLDVGTVLRMPDVVVAAPDEESGTAEELVGIVDRAATALTASREAEGARLAKTLTERIDAVASAVERIAARAPERLTAQRDRLRERVAELAGGVQVDEQRLVQEIAILADRLDVSEELDRFASHLEAFRQTLRAAQPDGVGKRLGFLLQELLREANTTGSKANDATITRDVVAIKEELERIREQVENLE